ncbi:MAG: hypothetical protein EA424_06195, partial [Planctomycetaceae bacterium]
MPELGEVNQAAPSERTGVGWSAEKMKEQTMRICKRTICAALLCGVCFPSATLHAAAGQQPEGDVSALIASLTEAIDAGSKTFAIAPAVYRFGRRSFELKNVRDMEIDGQGATFIFALRGGRVRLE